MLLGEKADVFYEEFPPLFRSKDIKYSEPGLNSETTERVSADRSHPSKEKENSPDNTAEVLEELEVLRKKNHKLETDNGYLRGEVTEKRRTEEENKKLKVRVENMNRELAALRSYVYNLTESDNPIPNESTEKMKEELVQKRIVVVGGHPNWVAKLKRDFPDWVYVNPDAGGSSSVSVVDKADKVYFFTDLISHSKYNQFMNIIRERNIDFGYIHGVNIDKNIRGIYRDMVEK